MYVCIVCTKYVRLIYIPSDCTSLVAARSQRSMSQGNPATGDRPPNLVRGSFPALDSPVHVSPSAMEPAASSTGCTVL